MSFVDSILFPEGPAIPTISPCDHYAGTEKLILKSLEIQNRLGGVFDITCDLEDGAAIGAESILRKMICEIIASSLNEHRRVGVRVHDFASPHFGVDLEEVIHSVGSMISHITIPKVANMAQAKDIVESVRKSCVVNNLNRIVPIHLLVETHAGVHDAWQIAALPCVRGLDFGLMDYVSSHYGALPDSCMRSPGQFENPMIVSAKTAIIAACYAHGIVPVHNVTVDFNDPERTRLDALRARTEYGFMRMWSIHPNQIGQILAAFEPDPAEIAKAVEIILAANEASWAPIRHNDLLHDRASFRYYWSILKRAKQSGVDLPEDVESLF